ncbi:MAG: efflux RND transporter periplasmic adaptor subunit [Bacteroidales bacterium]|nr:efflux RND transporter periplasmic adaptor subunit [Bacteroidales bacterium]
MKKVKILTAFLAASMLVMMGCSNSATKDETTEQKTVDEKVKVKIAQVHSRSIDQLYEYTATVEANAVNNIAPTIPGRIDKILVEVGDNVKAGQLLAQMDDASLDQAKAQLDNLELTFNRIDELYKVGGVAKSDWDAQKTALDVARRSYNNLAENTQLLSPISGIVTARHYDAGDLYAGNPILQIQQIVPVKLIINVSEAQYTIVKKGMKASIKLADVYGDEEFIGTVNLIYPTIDSRTHTFPVEIIIPNNNGRVRPGMYARVVMTFGVQDHVVVPDQAIIKQTGSGDRYVYVYKDGKVSYNKVELGRRIDNSYELISGINDGDYVVITGQSRLNNGKEVEVIE